MSQMLGDSRDAASRAPPDLSALPPGTVIERNTDGVPPVERLAYWREAVLKRMEPVELLTAEGRPFRGRLVRVVGRDVEFACHSSDAIRARRDAARCAADDCDDISVSFMLSGGSESTRNVGEQRIASGDVYFVDYARPVHMLRSRHSDASLIISRRRVAEVLGGDASRLGGVRLPRRGIAALLTGHVRRLTEELPHLALEHRAVAISVAMEMALATLQQAREGMADADRFGRGLYRSARLVIERDCVNPGLTPAAVAIAVGCSRATLYRLFAAHGESVAAAIWAARLAHAAVLIASPGETHLGIGEIAFRSGFLDQPTFSRMFKRRYGMTARDARETARAR